MAIQVGDVVLYTLTAERANDAVALGKPIAANKMAVDAADEKTEGQAFPLVVTAIRADGSVDGHLFVNDNPTPHLITAAAQGAAPGHWQERV